MSRSAETPERARMFIALDLPERVREDIVAWGERELTDPALRRVPFESLHVTLAFLGDLSVGVVERIELLLEELGEVPILLELEGPVGRPASRPRVVALPVNSNPVVAHQRDLAELLAWEGLYKPPKRPYWPHVTVARVRAERGGSRRPRPVRVPSGPSPTARTGWFGAVRLSLYRSQLQSDGARYVPLAQVELPD